MTSYPLGREACDLVRLSGAGVRQRHSTPRAVPRRCSVFGAVPRRVVDRLIGAVTRFRSGGTNRVELLGRQEPDIPLGHRVRAFRRPGRGEQTVHDLERPDPRQRPAASHRITSVRVRPGQIVDRMDVVPDPDVVPLRVVAESIFDPTERDAALNEVWPQVLEESPDPSLREVRQTASVPFCAIASFARAAASASNRLNRPSWSRRSARSLPRCEFLFQSGDKHTLFPPAPRLNRSRRFKRLSKAGPTRAPGVVGRRPSGKRPFPRDRRAVENPGEPAPEWPQWRRERVPRLLERSTIAAWTSSSRRISTYRSGSRRRSSSSNRSGRSTTSATTTPGRRRWSTSTRPPAGATAAGRAR
jgi:hypothetical protein